MAEAATQGAATAEAGDLGTVCCPFHLTMPIVPPGAKFWNVTKLMASCSKQATRLLPPALSNNVEFLPLAAAIWSLNISTLASSEAPSNPANCKKAPSLYSGRSWKACCHWWRYARDSGIMRSMHSSRSSSSSGPSRARWMMQDQQSHNRNAFMRS